MSFDAAVERYELTGMADFKPGEYPHSVRPVRFPTLFAAKRDAYERRLYNWKVREVKTRLIVFASYTI